MNTRLYCRHVLLPEGWRKDRTLEIGPQGELLHIHAGRLEGARELAGPVLPGMVNVHSHIHQRLIAGLTGFAAGADDSFWSWRERMYQAVGMLDGEGFRTLASYAFMELLEGGYTSTGEFHYPHRLGGQAPLETAIQLLEASQVAGMALTLLPVWYRYAGFGRRPLGEGQRPFALGLEELLELIAQLRELAAQPDYAGLLQVGVAPHSLRAVDARDLPQLITAMPEGPVHLHISEQRAEVADCVAAHGCTPIQWLMQHVELDSRWCLIHATHATESEWRALAQRALVLGICPTTEADLGDGLFPVSEYLQAGGRIAIGSDSNLVMSAAEELRLLEWGQRLRLHRRNVLARPGEHVGTASWLETTRSGAQALQQPAGRLEPGLRADLLVLDSAHPLLAGLDPAAQLDSFIFAQQPGMVDEVHVAGRCQVRGGRHLQRAALETEVADLRQQLSRRN